jgi:hypothetical protein
MPAERTLGMKRARASFFVVAFLSCGIVGAAAAQPRHAPPPEAYSACAGKKAADTCSVQFGQRTIDGACTMDEQQNLFCRPAMGPGGEHRRAAPPEAFSACQGKSVNQQCAVQLPDRAVSGTCSADEQNNLFCRPDRPTPPPGGNARQ